MKFGRKVVVSGYGWETPLGNDINRVWQDLLHGKIGIASLDSNITQTFDQVTFGGKCKEFDPTAFVSKKEARRLSDFVLLATNASVRAWESAKLEGAYEPHRIGAFLSSGIGGSMDQAKISKDFYSSGAGKISPFAVPGTIINMAAGYVSIHLNIQGPSLSICSACTSGAQAIGHAARAIAVGQVDAVLCGGTEASITDFSLACFARMGALSTRNDEPERASRPWDIDRDGFVMSEGAGIVVLEAEETAKARGAEILAIVSGFGESSDAYHVAAPRPDSVGAIHSIKMALEDAGIRPEEIGYVNAHATSTPTGDQAEIEAMRTVFGAKRPRVNGSKAQIGHMLGASGSVESIISILSLRDQKIHPCANLDNIDSTCEYSQSTSIETINTRYAATNSFGFGGHNSTLIFSLPN